MSMGGIVFVIAESNFVHQRLWRFGLSMLYASLFFGIHSPIYTVFTDTGIDIPSGWWFATLFVKMVECK